MKTCPKCNEFLPATAFKPGKGRPDGLSSWCRPCSKEAQRAYYVKNKEQWAVDTQARRIKVRAAINAAKSKPCADCKMQYPPYVMDFDHTDPSLKIDNVASLVTYGVNKVLKEIAKCDVVCANCHRERTYGPMV